MSRRDTAVVGLAVAAILFLITQLLDFGYGRDQGIYAVVARAIVHGGAPYVDAWDFKPPGIFLVYAVANLFSASPLAIRILEAVCLLSLVPAFALLTRLYLNDARPGVFGAMLAVLTHVQLEFWHTAQPESFGAVCVAWALVAAAYAMERSAMLSRRQAVALWLTCGALYGMATLLKPTIGIAGVATLMAGLAAARQPWSPRNAIAITVPPLIAGLALVIAACVVFLIARGAWSGFVDAAFIFTPRYTALSWASTSASELASQTLADWLSTYSLLNLVGLLLLGLCPASSKTVRGAWHVGGALLLLVGGAAVQLKLFPYHFSSALVLTGLLAGVGYWQLWQRLRDSATGVVAFASLVLILVSARSATVHTADSFLERCRLRLVAWSDPVHRTAIRDRLYSVNDYDAAANRDASGWVRRETRDGSSLFIWGFTPEIYETADRAPVSRYIHNAALRASWSRDEARHELMAALAQHPPSAVLVESRDAMPMVTASDTDSEKDLEGFAALRDYLARNYRRVERNRKFTLYTRHE